MKGTGERKVELAANALADRVTERVSVYMTEKVAGLEARSRRPSCSSTRSTSASARPRSSRRDNADQSIPLEQRLRHREPQLRDHDGDARRAAIQDARFEADQLLNLAENVESSRIVEPAAASKTTARSSRSSLLVGALIGLILGAIRRARRRPDRRPATRIGVDLGLMFDGKRVAVVVPAFDEERLVGETIRGIPELVDRIYVVDDTSRDGTAAAAEAVGDPRIEVLRHERNAGVGAAIATGYRKALEEEIDVTCVMAADNQMDPTELESLIAPVVRGEVEYAKANRLVSGEAWEVIPRTRYLGNAVLSLLTKIASGYWHVADSQAGYTALSLTALRRLDLGALYPRYGFPNDMLVHLNVQNARVRDVPSRPIYDVGERSGIRLRSVVPRISWLLFKGFWWRMAQKYVIRDFHPLVFFYSFGALMLGAGLLLGLVELVLRIAGNAITPATIVLVAVLLIAGLQMTLFAMWFDMEANKDLR